MIIYVLEICGYNVSHIDKAEVDIITYVISKIGAAVAQAALVHLLIAVGCFAY